MKIGMVSEFYYPQPGGISEHIRSVSRELRQQGHEVVVLTSRIRGTVPESFPRVVRLGRSLPVRTAARTWLSPKRARMRTIHSASR